MVRDRSRKIKCALCGVVALVQPRGKNTSIYCGRSCSSKASNSRSEVRLKISNNLRKPPILKKCEVCLTIFSFRSRGVTKNNRRRFCSNRCAAVYRMRDPEVVARRISQMVSKAFTPEALRKRWTPERRRQSSEWMRALNSDPAIREKTTNALRGRTFLSRGGNGKITIPQKMLAAALGDFQIEYAILTFPARGKFQSLPPVYKVDLAKPSLKLAIEVDGKSHRTKKWKFLDKRKTEILNYLGWRVVRFSNEEVLSNLRDVVRKVSAEKARLKGVVLN